MRLLGEPSYTHYYDDPYIMQFLSRQHRGRTTAHLLFWSQPCQVNLSLLVLKATNTRFNLVTFSIQGYAHRVTPVELTFDSSSDLISNFALYLSYFIGDHHGVAEVVACTHPGTV